MSYQVFIGDCIDSMRKMPGQSVHSCITSPPYYGLRDYGVEGQIGLEESPEAFIQRLVGVFREVRRVLRDDGTLWVNMGDSWDKGKQLNGMPWRFAFALQNDGWILRQDIIWHKSNPMPESVRDRCTKAHEYIFLLSKSKRYYFDHEAIREPSVYRGKNTGVGFGHGMDKSDRNRGRVSARDNFKRKDSKRAVVIPGQNVGTHRADRKDTVSDGMRAKRNVWTVATRGYKEAHFATFPPTLIEPCVLAGCPAGGVVLDPFGGSGTTAGVAIGNGRKAILCELNPAYADLVPARIESILSAYSVKKRCAA
ncbi:site-specific DNA-methyltransferase [Yersinia ruckeri]|uniref:DNA-methyltransferase n=1 Tax=Yersinia ruckeri TaxID=29486 RepID=UPI0020BF6F97|nr:site-specific DNA-methyltransferase [Yersinia ruckeri]EKN4181131.1 site-specific DNA-methyltransferase [Yersinia ruckeri]MCK8553820.1 site-specific DNA-methyltransferase [Yersinia ruckeri]UZX96163.1 site-specific DNA-methyltransferase [Yersinia ruckeri]